MFNVYQNDFQIMIQNDNDKISYEIFSDMLLYEYELQNPICN